MRGVCGIHTKLPNHEISEHKEHKGNPKTFQRVEAEESHIQRHITIWIKWDQISQEEQAE